MSQQQNDQTKPIKPGDEDRSPSRQKDHARDEKRDQGGKDVPGADAVDSAGAEEDTYD